MVQLFSFTAPKCPQKAEISDGKKATLSADGVSYGSVVKFTCDEGYELVGSPVVVCQQDGTWSGSDKIQCQSMCKYLCQLARLSESIDTFREYLLLKSVDRL